MISVYRLNSRSFRHVRRFRTIYSSKRHTISLILAALCLFFHQFWLTDLATFIYFLLIRSVGDFFVWQCCVCIWNFPEKNPHFAVRTLIFKICNILEIGPLFNGACLFLHLMCINLFGMSDRFIIRTKISAYLAQVDCSELWEQCQSVGSDLLSPQMFRVEPCKFLLTSFLQNTYKGWIWCIQ